MELRERLTRSRAGQEDAKCGGRPRRPYQRPTGQEATAAAESPERPGARRLQPRKVGCSAELPLAATISIPYIDREDFVLCAGGSQLPNRARGR